MLKMRENRLKEIAADKGPKGPSRDMADLNYWSQRASANSQVPPRATGSINSSPQRDQDLPDVHSTGRKMALRDTEMKPYAKRGDARAAAKADKNNVGSSDYMKHVRRITG